MITTIIKHDKENNLYYKNTFYDMDILKELKEIYNRQVEYNFQVEKHKTKDSVLYIIYFKDGSRNLIEIINN